MKRVNKKKEEVCMNNPIDHANLDLVFVEGFVDLLWVLCDSTIKTSAVSAMREETLLKIDALRNFIGSVPLDTEGNMYTLPRK